MVDSFDTTTMDTDSLNRYNIRVDSIKTDFEGFDNSVKDLLKDFIKEMPEYKNILVDGGSKSKYKDTDKFWKGISAAKDKDKLSVDDLIKYIGDNYNGDAQEEILEQLEQKRKETITPIREKAKQLIKDQAQNIKDNEGLINQEKTLINNLRKQFLALEQKQVEFDAIKDSYAPTDPEYKKAEEDCKRNENRMKGLEKLFQTHAANVLTHQNNLATFKANLKGIEQRMMSEFDKRGISVEDNEPTNNPGNPKDNNKDNSNSQGAGNAQISDKDKAKMMLKYLENTKKKDLPELLKGREFGDILEMEKHLSRKEKKEFRNLLKKNAKHNNIDIKGKLTNKEYNDINTFLKNISKKTPEEIAKFDEKIQEVAYKALIEGKDSEEFRTIRAKLTHYYDEKEKIGTKQNEFKSRLSVAVGKNSIEVQAKQKLSERAKTKYQTTGDTGRDW